jgi:formylglycine-generating enzyme required for sulfatase activity
MDDGDEGTRIPTTTTDGGTDATSGSTDSGGAMDVDSEPAPAEPGDDLSQADIEVQVAQLHVVTPTMEPSWWPLGSGVLLLLVAAGLSVRMWLGANELEALRLPEPSEPDPALVPEAAPPPPLTRRLLDRDAREMLVWGIGQHVSEVQTERLDVAATVRATVEAGGLAELRFERAREYGGVSLWVDQAPDGADRVLIERLADDLQAALEAADLPVTRASFHRVPHELWHPDGRTWGPQDADEHARQARVAVLTDGVGVLRHEGEGDRRELELTRTLAQLAGWEHLAFVGVGTRYDALTESLRRFGIPCVRPVDTVAHLVAASRSRGREAAGRDFVRWQVACMLAPDEIALEDALELRSVLGLDVEAFELRALWQTADPRSDHLRWSTAERRRRLRWYAEAYSLAWSVAAVAEDALLRRALEHWEHQCLAKGRLVDAAVVRLWTEPELAASRLHALYQHGPESQGRIETLLAELTALDVDPGGDARIVLPWRLDRQPAHVQQALAALGFGGARERATADPGWSWRWWAGLGSSLAGAVGSLVVFGVELSQAPTGTPTLAWVEPPPEHSDGWCDDDGCGVAWPTGVRWMSAGPGAQVEVRWAVQSSMCEEVVARGRVVRCTSEAVAPESTLVQVQLWGSPKDSEARALAQVLLDTQTAHVVVMGEGRSLLEVQLGPVLPGVGAERWVLAEPSAVGVEAMRGVSLVARTDSWEALDKGMWFTGRASAKERWPGLEVIDGDPSEVWLVGARDPELVARVEAEKQPALSRQDPRCGDGMVYIEGGAFTSGEKTRTIDPFCMDVVEVTVSRYRLCRSCTKPIKAAGAADASQCSWVQEKAFGSPVNCVDWDQARTYCSGRGKRLPTEWEWEWAARGREEARPYPWGSEAPTCDLAVMSGCERAVLKPVGSTPRPTSLDGVRDMAGSVAEWTSSTRGARPIVRGGGWDSSAEELLVSTSVTKPKSLRSVAVGFRCVANLVPKP